MKMKCTVFYESWQLECCGKAFSIGDIVKWFVDLGTIDYCYEAHDENWEKLFVRKALKRKSKI